MEDRSPSKKMKRDRNEVRMCASYIGFIVGTNAIELFLLLKWCACVRAMIIYSLNVWTLLFFPAADEQAVNEREGTNDVQAKRKKN